MIGEKTVVEVFALCPLCVCLRFGYEPSNPHNHTEKYSWREYTTRLNDHTHVFQSTEGICINVIYVIGEQQVLTLHQNDEL